jgi:hypothetical protein
MYELSKSRFINKLRNYKAHVLTQHIVKNLRFWRTCKALSESKFTKYIGQGLLLQSMMWRMQTNSAIMQLLFFNIVSVNIEMLIILWVVFFYFLSIEVIFLLSHFFAVVFTFSSLRNLRPPWCYLSTGSIISCGRAVKNDWLAVVECGHALSCTSRTAFQRCLRCFHSMAVCKHVCVKQ